jgi:hypothetical protein
MGMNPKGSRSKMQSLYMLAKDALEGMQHASEADMPSCEDMDDQRWQLIFGGILAELAAKICGKRATVEQMSATVQFVEDAVATYKRTQDQADEVAMLVLGDLYPKPGLVDGQHRS